MTIPTYSFRILRTYPHDRQAFTQGLQYENGYLYESTGQYGQSSIRKVELETGKVLQKLDIPPQYFGEGLVLWKERIIQLTWTSGVGFVYNKETFQQEDQFRYSTEGWGITEDGRSLIMSDGTNLLYFLNPETKKVEKWLEVKQGSTPIRNLNELEYIKGEIYANIWQEDRIARINPESGQIVGWINLQNLLPAEERSKADVLNGIAYDSVKNRLFVTGKWWPSLFEIQCVPLGKTTRIRP